MESQEKLKARPLKPVTLSQPIVNAKETLLAEIKGATLVNTQILRKWNTLIADIEKVLSLEDQTSHGIPFSQSLISSVLWRLREVKKLQKGSLKLAELFHEVKGKKPSP